MSDKFFIRRVKIFKIGSMTLKLVVTTNVNGDVFELVLKNARYGVGRRHDNDLRIKETYISGYHSELLRTEDGDYVVTDLGSSNGTFLNGRRIDGKENIKAGDFIKFGILKVAVQEHTDTMPKIVSLRDRPAFARKDESNTTAIAVDKMTGPLSLASAIEAKGETKATPPADGAKDRLAELESRLEEDKLARTSLEKELESLRRDLASRESELKTLTTSVASASAAADELKTVRASLAKAGEAGAGQEKELAQLREEIKNASAGLSGKAEEAARLAAELSTLKSVLTETESREQKAREEISAAVVSKDETIKRLDSQVKSLTEALSAKEGDLKATAKKAAKISILNAEIASLRSELDETKSKFASGVTDKTTLESALAGKTDELATLRATIDKLTAVAEKEKSGLATELESTRTVAEKERAALESKLAEQSGELATLQATIDKLTAAAAKEKSGLATELESTRTVAEKERAALESKLAEQSGELATLRATIDKLTAVAEKEKSGLATELAAATLAATTIKSEFSKLRDESITTRKERDQQVRELENEKEKLGRTLESLETKFASKDEELANLKSALAGKDKAVLSAVNEAKEAAKRIAELEQVKSDLEAARDNLAATTRREEEARAEAAEASRRLEKLETELKAGILEKEKHNEELTTRLTAAEKSAGAEIATLTAELEKARIAITDKSTAAEQESTRWQDEIATLTAKVAGSLSQIASTNRQLDEAQRLVGGSEIERASLRSELNELQKRAASAGEETPETRARFAAIEAERNDLADRLKTHVNDLQAAKAEANDLRVELKKTKEKSESSLLEIERSLKTRIAELETSLASERVLARDALSLQSGLESSLEELRKNHESLNEELVQLKSRNEESSRNSGRLQAELNREAAERSRISAELDSSRSKAGQLVREVEDLRQALVAKDRELAEREQQFSRSESDTLQKLKRELGEAVVARDAAEERSTKANKEKLSLSGAYERLKEQLDLAEANNRKAKEAEDEYNHSKGLLARRLEKAEASNGELAARIKEEALALIANRDLIAKLEHQLRENESEAVRREQEQVVALRADLAQMKRQSSDEERQRAELDAELARSRESKRLAEERILELNERLLERESETISTRTLLTGTEKKRGELASLLAEESALAATRAKALEALRTDLANTIERFKASESDLLAKHGDEIDGLLAELRSERAHKEGLEVELSNTRIGMSNALRRARDESAAAQAKLIAEGNAKLSAVEDTLSEAIRAREETEHTRSELEDELNQRDEHIEKLSGKIEDLEIHLRDEIEARHAVLSDLETTRAGFSRTLQANWSHLDTARLAHEKEKSARETYQTDLAAAREDIARLTATLEEQEQRYRTDIREWENRYDALREEKLTLASEDANLNKIREQILEANAKKRQIESELTNLGTGMKDFQSRHRELQMQKNALLGEREELKAGLNVARSELDSLQQRCLESKAHEGKLSDTIIAAERRIQSLRKLEAEMEQAVERKRQQQILSRGDVFSEPLEALAATTEFSQEEFYRKLVAKLDLLDDLTKRYDNKWRYPKVAEQLGILKRGFVDFLQDHSVRQFDLEPGTVLSITERKRIKLVPLQNGAVKKPGTNGNGSSTQVVETLRPGYVYRDGTKDVIIRKAEVVVS
jgi:chromosome segregation ATPase